MNASQQVGMPQQTVEAPDEINISEYVDIIFDNRWFIAIVTVAALVLGVAYALFARPVFESNLVIQVEDSEKSAGSFLGDAASSLFDVKTPAAGEIEIIRSRMILGQAVENTKMYINASPKYLPIIGGWLARDESELSDPGFLGFGGYVFGSEKIVVPAFDVPVDFEATRFLLTFQGDGNYRLEHSKFSNPVAGKVGVTLEIPELKGFKLLVSSISAKPGAQFQLARNSKLLTLNKLQDDIKVVEKGKQSGVLDVSLQGSDIDKLTQVLNELGRLYVRQNIDRKAAEAQKTLSFLNGQLPQFKRQLEQSEDVYNKYRNENGTVSLDEEAKNALAQVVALQSSLVEAQQKRKELTARFTDAHPAVQTLDSQIAGWNSEIASVNSRIKRMPILQQDAVRMQRDIKVNTDLYQSLLNSSLQMQLAKEGKVGNVRLIDDAVVPEEPIKPKKPLVISLAVALGVLFGIALSILRSTFFGGIRSPHEIEAHTGLNVYSTIPLSAVQAQLAKNAENKVKGMHLLALSGPQDPAIESLRSLRTALQFAMLESPNNRVLITGGTPSVGKSFVSINFAAIMAAAGKRVLLIDADLRKGYVNQFFGVHRAIGLSELIVGSIDVNKAVRREILPNLDLISTGVLPPNPAELLMSDSFANILDQLSPAYDLVIVDTAPVLVAADTAAVAPHAGTILLVARADRTNIGELHESVKRIGQAGQTVTGVLFNAMDMTKRHYGSYGYKYGRYRYAQYSYGEKSN